MLINGETAAEEKIPAGVIIPNSAALKGDVAICAPAEDARDDESLAGTILTRNVFIKSVKIIIPARAAYENKNPGVKRSNGLVTA